MFCKFIHSFGYISFFLVEYKFVLPVEFLKINYSLNIFLSTFCACVVMQYTCRSRGFGFVTFKDAKMLEECQSCRPHNIDGKTVDTKRAMPKTVSSPSLSYSLGKATFVT